MRNKRVLPVIGLEMHGTWPRPSVKEACSRKDSPKDEEYLSREQSRLKTKTVRTATGYNRMSSVNNICSWRMRIRNPFLHRSHDACMKERDNPKSFPSEYSNHPRGHTRWGNLRKACKQVVRNKGSAGVDGNDVNSFRPYQYIYPQKVAEAVSKGYYEPQPIKRVYIPKDNGEKRPLGIPTVIDRFVQQATPQVLSAYYEKEFSNNSFGFRLRRCCRDAILVADKNS